MIGMEVAEKYGVYIVDSYIPRQKPVHGSGPHIEQNFFAPPFEQKRTGTADKRGNTGTGTQHRNST